LETSQKRTTRC